MGTRNVDNAGILKRLHERQFGQRWHEERADIEQLCAENEKLREALKPFADLGAAVEPDWKNEVIYGWYDCEMPVEITVDDLRRAAQVLKGDGNG